MFLKHKSLNISLKSKLLLLLYYSIILHHSREFSLDGKLKLKKKIRPVQSSAQIPLVGLLLAWHWPLHHSPAYRPSPNLERRPPSDRATCQNERSSSAAKHWYVKAEIKPLLSKSSCSLLLVCLPPPLIRLGWVWVDADGSVTVSDGSVGLLHFHIYAERHKQVELLNSQSNQVTKKQSRDWMIPGSFGIQNGQYRVEFDGLCEEVHSFL